MPSARPRQEFPPSAGRLRGLHLRAGRLLIMALGMVRPRVTLGVRLAAFDAGGRVFLVRHSYLPGWHLPGGGVETGETCREAAVREAREEGGLMLAGPPALFGVYLNRALGNRDHVVLFVARGVREGARERRLEIREAGFHPPAALPEGLAASSRRRIDEILHGAEPSDVW